MSAYLNALREEGAREDLLQAVALLSEQRDEVSRRNDQLMTELEKANEIIGKKIPPLMRVLEAAQQLRAAAKTHPGFAELFLDEQFAMEGIDKAIAAAEEALR